MEKKIENNVQRRLAELLDKLGLTEKQLGYIHHSSFRNSERVAATTHPCGCFCCCEIFPASEVTEFIAEQGEGPDTAVCPRCGIDSVLTHETDSDPIDITPDLLEAMMLKYF